MAIVVNRKNTSVVVHAVANTTWVIAGNSAVSNVATGNEDLTGAAISQVWFGSPSGNAAHWTVTRGSNVVAVFDGSGHVSFSKEGCALGLYPAANVTVTLTGATAGYIMVELQKQGTQTEYV